MALELGPNSDQIEVSLFGPGVGEALAVHLCDGVWMLVDSCIDSTSGTPAPARYLDLLGVAPESVELIVGTHWHDDHMRGISELVRRYPAARFYCSSVLKDDDFHAFVAGGATRMLTSAGTTELAAVLRLFDERQVHTGRRPLLVWPDRPVWRRNSDSVRALSPSDESVKAFLVRVAALYPSVGDAKTRIPSIRPNDASVVLWIEVGGGVVLLGADLEHRSDPVLGWQAILDSPVRPQRLAEVIKVPHHGSATGHDEGVWNQMLVGVPTAVLTPFARSGLPKSTDVTRVCGLTPEAYITALVSRGKSRSRPSAVTKTIEGAVRYLREAEPQTGHIRLRKHRSGGSWTVELFAPAAPLCPQ